MSGRRDRYGRRNPAQAVLFPLSWSGVPRRRARGHPGSFYTRFSPALYAEDMNALMIIGIVLLVLGVVALAYQGISFTTTENVVDLGPLKVEAKKERTIPLPPVLGGVAVAAGVVLLIVGARRR